MPNKPPLTWNTLVHVQTKFPHKPTTVRPFGSVPITKNIQLGRSLFKESPWNDPVSLNSTMNGYVRRGITTDALWVFRNSLETHKSSFAYRSVVGELARSGKVESARSLFEEMPEKDAIALNSVMHGYVRLGMVSEALRIFRNFSLNTGCCDAFVITTGLNACARRGDVDSGRQLHGRLVAGGVGLDSVLSSALVDMYCKCWDLDSAVCMFDSMPKPDQFSLSAIISGYSGCNRCEEARKVFDRGRSTIRNMGIVVWNSMLTGYVSNGRSEDALELFGLMRRERGLKTDPSTLVCALNACVCSIQNETGKQVHAQCLKFGASQDVIVGTALIDFYSKSGVTNDALKIFSEMKQYDTVLLNSMVHVYSSCGRTEDARWVFNTTRNKTLISWNSMIAGYSQNGCAVEAIELFCQMNRFGFKLDKVAISSVLSSCACLTWLRFGEQVFALATVRGLESDPIVATSLIDLYCKCGAVQNGRKLFNAMSKFDDAPWNSMLMGYATNGCGHEALELFENMLNSGAKPNEVTFIGVLTGCCHCGLVSEGQKWFGLMKEKYKINPIIEHYACMVDLLVRAGRMEESMEFIKAMPIEADVGMWTSVLRGCIANGNVCIGKKAVERLFEIDPTQAGTYLQLSSVYAAHGDWEKSEEVRKTMLDKRIFKDPGLSWTTE